MNIRRVVLSVALVVLHIVPLLLASTAFTVVTAPFGGSSFNWNYFAWCYANGWGYVFHSDYSLGQVLAYLVAYGSGMVLYPLLTRPRFLGVGAAVICGVGVASFGLELTHWFFEHHLSLIGSFPVLLAPIAVWTVIVPWWELLRGGPKAGIQPA